MILQLLYIFSSFIFRIAVPFVYFLLTDLQLVPSYLIPINIVHHVRKGHVFNDDRAINHRSSVVSIGQILGYLTPDTFVRSDTLGIRALRYPDIGISFLWRRRA